MSSRELYSEINITDCFESYYNRTVQLPHGGCTFQFSTDQNTQTGCLFPRSVRIGEGLPDLGSFQSISKVKDFLLSLSVTHKISASMRKEMVPLMCRCSNGDVVCCSWIAESLSIEKKKPSDLRAKKTESVRARVRKIDWDAAVAALEAIEPSHLKNNLIYLNFEVLTIDGLAFKKGSNSSIFYDQEVCCDVQTLPTNNYKPSKLRFQFDLFALNGRICEQVLSSHDAAHSKLLIKTKDPPNTFIGTIAFVVQTPEIGSGGCINIFNPKFGVGHEMKVWFSGRNIFRRGKSLENTSLREELFVGDPVMVYFERFNAPSLKVQAQFKIPFEAILVTIGEPNCADPIFHSITQGNVKLDPAVKGSSTSYKFRTNEDALLPIPLEAPAQHSKLQAKQEDGFPPKSYQDDTDEEKLLKRLSAKLGQSSRINVIEDDVGLSAGLRIISTLSNDLINYCLAKDRRKIAKIFLDNKNTLSSVSQFLKVLSASIEDSPPTSNKKLPESSTKDHSTEMISIKEKFTSDAFYDKRLKDEIPTSKGDPERRKYEMPSTSKAFNAYEMPPQGCNERTSNSAEDIYSKGLDVEKFLISLDNGKYGSRTGARDQRSSGHTGGSLPYQREGSSSESHNWSRDAYTKSPSNYRGDQRAPFSNSFEDRDSGLGSKQRSPTSTRRYLLDPPGPKYHGNDSEDLRETMTSKRFRHDHSTYDDMRQRQGLSNWESDVPCPFQGYRQQFS